MSSAAEKFLAANPAGSQSAGETGGYIPVVRVEIAPSPAWSAASATEVRRTGLTLTLPALFRRPWAHKWIWVLLAHAAIALILCMLSLNLGAAPLKAAYAFVMSMAIPSAMTCLFVEWDVTRRTAPASALATAIVCGGLSAFAAGELNARFGITAANAGAAAFTEEPLKGVMVIALLLRTRRFPCILSGLALGCAVGAGFAVIETFEYSYMYSSGGDPSTGVLLLRGFLSPLTHMAWTAALAVLGY